MKGCKRVFQIESLWLQFEVKYGVKLVAVEVVASDWL